MENKEIIEEIKNMNLSKNELETILSLAKIINKVNLNWIVLLYDDEKDRIVFINQNTYNVSTYDLNDQSELSALIQDLTLTWKSKEDKEFNVLLTSGSGFTLPIEFSDMLIWRLIYNYQTSQTKDLIKLMKHIENITKNYIEYYNKKNKKITKDLVI